MDFRCENDHVYCGMLPLSLPSAHEMPVAYTTATACPSFSKHKLQDKKFKLENTGKLDVYVAIILPSPRYD